MDLICESTSFFKNPSKLPLNELFFDFKKTTCLVKNEHTLQEVEEMLGLNESYNSCYKVEVIKRPALDKCWIDRKNYEKYQPYYLHLPEEENGAFMENVLFLNRLNFLTECTYHQFWCYMSYEPQISRIIKDFLKSALPLHLLTHLTETFLNLHNEVHWCVYKIYERLVEFNLNELQYLSKEVAMDILQSTGLFTPETIIMLCYVYNYNMPQFIQVIKDTVPANNGIFQRSIKEILSKILEQLEDISITSFNMQLSTNLIEEKALFLFELASSLHHFLFVFSSAVDIAFNLELPCCIASTYQKMYIGAKDVLDETDGSFYKNMINKLLEYGKYEFINLYHVFTTYCIDRIINLSDDLTKQDDYIIHYISLISNALDYDLFVIAYNKTYPISIQFETLVSSIPNFDVHQTEYLLQNLNKIISEVDIPTETKSDVIAKKVIFNKKQYDFIYQTLSAHLERHQNTKSSSFPKNVSLALEQYYELTKQFDDSDKIIQDGMPCSSKPNEDEIDLRVKAVLDVLPHLQASFALKCLEKTNYNVNDVITDVLSNNLSSTLCSPSTSRQKYSNANELLDDKEEKQKIKEFVLKASYIFDLDDEYDDRTEMSNVKNDSSDSESGIYRHLGNYNKIAEEDDGSSSDDTQELPERNTKLDFCTDPAVLRDIRKTQYQNKRKVIPKKTVEETSNKPKHSKSHKPKHNRRGGAEWKRSKGMIPS